MTLSVPHLEIIGNHFIVRWDEGVLIEFKRLYAHRDYHIDAEIVITDEQELIPHLLGPVRSSITKTWRSIIRELSELSERDDWHQRLTQASILVQEAHRAGAPIVSLGGIDPPGVTQELLSGVIYEGMPTLVFGPGGIGKSIIGLNMMSAVHTGRPFAGLPVTQSNCLILDWETSERQTWHRNHEILEAQSIDPGPWPDPDFPMIERTGMVYYRFQSGPLWDDVEFLNQQIAELRIGTICIDSAGPACGGEPESASATLKFFEALRSLSNPDAPLQSLILAHVTHEGRRAGGGRAGSPFGSVYWLNLPRSVFELQSAQEEGSNYSDFALHHRKSNLGPLHKPLGFRLTWDEGCSIDELDIRQNAALVAGLPLPERALILIRESQTVSVNGHMARALSVGNMAEMMDVTQKNLASALQRDRRFVLSDGLWSESADNW